MKSGSLRIYVFEFCLAIFLLLTCIYNVIFTRIVTAVVLLVFMVIAINILKNNKIKSIHSKQIVIIMTTLGIVFVMLKYIMGIYFGYYNATVIFSNWSVINYILPYIAIILSTEIIRKAIVLMAPDKENLSKIIYVILMSFLEFTLLNNISSLFSTKDWFDAVALTLLPSIASNILYNFVLINFKEEKGIILYRIIITLYIYFIPIIPNIDPLIESVMDIVMPCIIYFLLSKYLNNKKLFSVKNYKLEKTFTLILVIFVTIVIMLISCKFRYGALVIGSGSMTGTIDKGDVIIYETYVPNLKKRVRKGDIIIFNQGDRKIVHRIIEERTVNGNEVYYTKGDANDMQDEWLVYSKDIIGVYKMKIPYIGNITLSINNLLD